MIKLTKEELLEFIENDVQNAIDQYESEINELVSKTFPSTFDDVVTDLLWCGLKKKL